MHRQSISARLKQRVQAALCWWCVHLCDYIFCGIYNVCVVTHRWLFETSWAWRGYILADVCCGLEYLCLWQRVHLVGIPSAEEDLNSPSPNLGCPSSPVSQSLSAHVALLGFFQQAHSLLRKEGSE